MKETKFFKFISLSEREKHITVLGAFMRKYQFGLISL